MNGRRVRRLVSGTAESVMLIAAGGAKLIPRGKILLSAAFAASTFVVAVPLLFEAGTPPVAADGTLKCYDGAGNHQPCVTQASAPPARLNRPAIGPLRPPSWTTTALYQQSSWTTTSVDPPTRWATPAVDQQSAGATAALDQPPGAAADQPENSTSAPVVRHGRWGRRQASAACKRHLIPCFFATLRKGLTHIASAAANLAKVRPAREHL
jgi:hypothetical protein